MYFFLYIGLGQQRPQTLGLWQLERCQELGRRTTQGTSNLLPEPMLALETESGQEPELMVRPPLELPEELEELLLLLGVVGEVELVEGLLLEVVGLVLRVRPVTLPLLLEVVVVVVDAELTAPAKRERLCDWAAVGVRVDLVA